MTKDRCLLRVVIRCACFALATPLPCACDGNISSGIDHIFVLHHPALKERKQRLQDGLSVQNLTSLPITWIEEYPASELDALAQSDPRAYAKLYDAHRFLREGERHHHCLAPGPMTPKHLSVALKHNAAWREVVRSSGAIGAALILEDDVTFGDVFRSKLEAYLLQLRQLVGCTCEAVDGDQGRIRPALAWDLLSVGSGNPEMHANTEAIHVDAPRLFRRQWRRADSAPSNSIFAVSAHNMMRSCESYMVSYRGAQRLHARMLPLAFPIDNQMNYLLNTMPRGGADVYWAEPTIATQGSLHGVFESAAAGRNSYWPPAERVPHFELALQLRPDHTHHRHLQAELGVALCAAGRHREAGALFSRMGGSSAAARQFERASQLYSAAGEALQATEYLLAAHLVQASTARTSQGAAPPPLSKSSLRFLKYVMRSVPREDSSPTLGTAAKRAAIEKALALAATRSPELFGNVVQHISSELGLTAVSVSGAGGESGQGDACYE